ncbi:hypothetical protein ACFRJ8_12005 [Arthrobacter sp. NPDC056886]|uniref:hypothetical protein n=1 Tax=Arthrobacter sp. NPDC056886 TaxID=3345960 RepID=UPI00366B777A
MIAKAFALSFNVFDAPEKPLVGERPRPFGPPMAWDSMTSTLIYGENNAVLVDSLTTVAEERIFPYVRGELDQHLRFEQSCQPLRWI